jgi:hypothetical protein
MAVREQPFHLSRCPNFRIQLKPQEGAARVSRAGSHREANTAQASASDALAPAGVDRAQPGVGFGFCQRHYGRRTANPRAGRDRKLHSTVSGIGCRSSFPSRHVTRVLERAIAAYGKPQSIRSDNGPERTSRHYLAWAIDWKIDLLHIQPGKPTQNARTGVCRASTESCATSASTQAGSGICSTPRGR